MVNFRQPGKAELGTLENLHQVLCKLKKLLWCQKHHHAGFRGFGGGGRVKRHFQPICKHLKHSCF